MGTPARRSAATAVLVLGAAVVAFAVVDHLRWPTEEARERAAYRLPLGSPVDPEAEANFLRERLRRDPGSALDRSALAGLYLAQARRGGGAAPYDRAASLARESLQLLPSPNPGARVILAEVAEARHEFPGAIRWALEVLEEDPRSESALSVLVTAHLGQGDPLSALEAAERLVDRVPTVGTLGLRALALEALGRDDEALDDGWRALTLEDLGEVEASASVRAWLGRFHLRHGDLATACALSREALRLVPGHVAAARGLGEVYLRWGHLEEATSIYLEAHAIHKEPMLLLALARVRRSAGDPGEATRLLAQAEAVVRAELRLTPVGHRTELAAILVERGGQEAVREAVDLARSDAALRRDPNTLATLARALLVAGDAPSARTAVRGALRWGYRDAELYHLAARIEASVGDAPRAALYRRLARDLDPTFVPVP
ncbi:MAG: tetratricopeptide repeat protein [Planctomycetes bacterium]|nr:tetratricopeptide repeat protein [Planctomycetota bacterium]